MYCIGLCNGLIFFEGGAGRESRRCSVVVRINRCVLVRRFWGRRVGFGLDVLRRVRRSVRNLEEAAERGVGGNVGVF